ncbi:MAG: SDR family NAD(P)-dependent oxidoreductase, partial [Dehalococcoidia bacterium]|nr:SDR family NAD(P)-dependent oxidoreductase [Dehalococcoidia bacterium]
MRLSGKVALITGGAGGLGACQARLFAAEGAAVAIADLRESAAGQLATEIEAGGGRSIHMRLDVADEASWAEAVDATVRRLGRPTVLIQNAGIYVRDSISTATLEQWEAVMAVNSRGVFLGTKAIVPHMIEAGG